MKKTISLLVIGVLFAFATRAQSGTWKELDDFHTVMSETYHPAEEGKLTPIKARSGEMLDKATAWLHAGAPQGFDKKAVKPLLKKLVRGSRQLHQLVREKADDKIIVEKLTALHDLFHTIEEKSRK